MAGCEKSTTSIVFTGDIGFDKYMDKKWKDEKLLDGEIEDFLHSGDHLIVNVEGPLCEKKIEITADGASRLLHTMDPEVAGFLQRIGADVWNICNNHIMDAGADGIEQTIKNAKRSKAITLGAGMNISEAMKPVIFDEAGGIGIISVGYQRACRKASEDSPGCFSWSDLDTIRHLINEIKKKCNWCIVVAHAGEEFTALPSPYTRKRYMDYLEMGADVVVAHHPHVPMNYETFPGKAIFYSLGNFVFDTDYQRSQPNTEDGVLLKLNFSKNDFCCEAMGIKINRELEKIERSALPDIFENVPEKEYELLKALSAKAFIASTKKQLRYMKPELFTNCSEEDFVKNFYEPLRSGRVPGETLDFQIIYPLACSEAGEWKESKLVKVRDYILNLI